MTIKLRYALICLSALCLFVFMTFRPSAETLTPTLIEMTDRQLGISFDIPKGSTPLFAKDPSLNTPLMKNGQTVVRFGWQDMVAQIDTFDIDFDFNHVDWLLGYSLLNGGSLESLTSLENLAGHKMAKAEVMFSSVPAEKVHAYLLVGGSRGYLISSSDQKSGELAFFIARNFGMRGMTWGQLTPTQSIEFNGKKLELSKRDSIIDLSKNEDKLAIISDNKDLSKSRRVMVLRQWPGASHEEFAQAFEAEVADQGFTYTLVRSTADEVQLLLDGGVQGNYEGYLKSSEEGIAISTIVPAIENDVNAWLEGLYWYLKASEILH